MNKPSIPRSWFIADIAIVSTTLWLCWWRWSLPMQAGPEATVAVWGTWTPIVALPALVVVAALVGAFRPAAGGFLPYVLRWAFVVCGLGLLGWIASDIASAPSREPSTVVGESVKAEREVAQALASVSTPQQRQRLEQALEAARAGEALGIAMERARAHGVDVPKSPAQASSPTEARPPERAPEGAPGMQEITALLLEYGDELAAGEIPEEVASFVKDAGLDQGQLLEQAALFLASKAIAHYFGAPYAIVFELLVALLDDGEITMGEVVRLGAAFGMAVTADGIDAVRLIESFDELGVQAQTAVIVMDALQAADIDVPEALVTLAKEMAGQDVEPNACDDDAVGRAFTAAGCSGAAAGCEPDRIDGFLQHSEVAACRQEGRAQRRALIVAYARRHRADLVPALEQAWK